jgi:hypothetical protein
MGGEQINRVSTIGLLVFSVIALLDVVILGYLRPLAPALRGDEGAGAHIFQLSVAAIFLVGLVFLATADWTQPTRVARRLALPAGVVIAAFALLYYLEHVFYPAHH